VADEVLRLDPVAVSELRRGALALSAALEDAAQPVEAAADRLAGGAGELWPSLAAGAGEFTSAWRLALRTAAETAAAVADTTRAADEQVRSTDASQGPVL
jgi:hypothetical protein